MTTPTDPPKPTRWRRHQLQMRLEKGGPPGNERRGASTGAVPPRGAVSASAVDPGSRKDEAGARSPTGRRR